MKKEKDKQSQQSPTTAPHRAIARTSTRGGSRGAATKKAGAGHTKVKLGQKPKPEGKLRLSGNGIKIEDDDYVYQLRVTKKRGSTPILEDYDTRCLQIRYGPSTGGCNILARMAPHWRMLREAWGELTSDALRN